MDCIYIKKSTFLKRIFGIHGYCSYHKTNIKKYRKLSYYPYFFCKNAAGEELIDCKPHLK